MTADLPTVIVAVAGSAVALLVNDARQSLRDIARDLSNLTAHVAHQDAKIDAHADRCDRTHGFTGGKTKA